VDRIEGMSNDEGVKPSEFSDAELAEMDRDRLVELGTEADGVVLAEYNDRWPVAGTRAERRAERSVAAWFVLAALAAAAFLGVFLFWPWAYQPATDGDKHFVYLLYTPLLGATLGISVLAVGIGMIDYAKKFFPRETAVQTRHDGASSQGDRKTLVALLADGADRTGVKRRSMITGSATLGLGVLGLGLGVFAIGGLIKNPWAKRDRSELWTSGWTPRVPGEKIYLRRDTGNPKDVVLIRPEDLAAGGFETVFPFRETERDDERALLKALRASDNPVMLIRLRPGQPVVKRAGQESFNYGDYYAFSKICTHLGCPTSLFEQQTGRLLCPCHQSQFDVFTYAKPVFGPAARALPQLPITVDQDGYFVAAGNFIEPIGPAFWERKS
jgi:ubiquinol-cytochrome c reductase iron-sulfur subunit